MTQPPLPYQQPDRARGAGKSNVFKNALDALRNGTNHADIYTDNPALLDAGAHHIDELKTAAAPERAVIIVQDQNVPSAPEPRKMLDQVVAATRIKGDYTQLDLIEGMEANRAAYLRSQPPQSGTKPVDAIARNLRILASPTAVPELHRSADEPATDQSS